MLNAMKPTLPPNATLLAVGDSATVVRSEDLGAKPRGSLHGE